jgi:hypothetical protein
MLWLARKSRPKQQVIEDAEKLPGYRSLRLRLCVRFIRFRIDFLAATVRKMSLLQSFGFSGCIAPTKFRSVSLK